MSNNKESSMHRINQIARRLFVMIMACPLIFLGMLAPIWFTAPIYIITGKIRFPDTPLFLLDTFIDWVLGE